ncbi:MAG: fluoride efflux transporter CrcB [Gemmatimonadota bacterium]|jgi:CrcB protein
MTLLVVGLGGALGAVSRYLSSGWVQTLAGGFFPWGTMAVNVAGSLMLGFMMVWLQSTTASPELRNLITVGFLGSFTTFSTFSYETTAMLRDGEWWRAGGYAAGSMALGLVAVGLGAFLATTLSQARS